MLATNPKSVLFTDSDAFAGTERHILDLAHGLRNLDVSVQIACPVTSPLAHKAREMGLSVLAIPKRGSIDFLAAGKLSALIRGGEIDLVHAHNGRTAIAAILAVGMAGRGCSVFTQHFVEPGHLKCGQAQRFVKSLVHRLVNRRIDHFIAISTAVREAMMSRDDAEDGRVTRVFNGIEKPNIEQLQKPEIVRAQYGIARNAPLLVCVARLEVEKDIPSLIEAMKSLIQTNSGVRCIIVGEGSQRHDLERRIRIADLEDKILMIGFQNDALSVVNAGDVFVLPSTAEPFGLVVLEAMALAKPVVAVMKGGPAEIVVDGETGSLVSESNPTAIAAAVRKLLEAPEERIEMGSAGRRRIEQSFSARQMASETIDVYHKAVLRASANR